MGGRRPWGDLLMLDWANPVYDVEPHPDKVEKVWLRLHREDWHEVRRAFRYGGRNGSSDEVYLRVTCKDALSELPPHAIRIESPRKRRGSLSVVDGLGTGWNREWHFMPEAQRPSTFISTDAHALYAYPLSWAVFLG